MKYEELPVDILDNLDRRSEKDKNLFLDFYEKNRYYKDGQGAFKEIPRPIFIEIASYWGQYPDELKEKKSLLSIAKHVSQYDNDPVYSYAVTEINEEAGTNFSEEISHLKEFALAQINYARDYFPSTGDYLGMCQTLLSLPDDKKLVYDFLNKYSMFNLNYVPNKIRLIDDYMPDKLNISFAEKARMLGDKTLKYEDFTGFQDKKNNFSYGNYLKSVDKVVALLCNDENAGRAFRKDFQYANIGEAVTYVDYSDYNASSYSYDDRYYDDYDGLDDYDDDGNGDNEYDGYDDDGYAEAEKTELKPILPDEHTLPIGAYLRNRDYVSQTALNLCRAFGSQTETFLARCAEAFGQNDVAGGQVKHSEDVSGGEIDFLTEAQFEVKNRIAAVRQRQALLKGSGAVSDVPLSVGQKIPMFSLHTQKKVLELLSILPSDYTSENYASLGKFILNEYFYKDTAGKLRARPTEELKKIVKVWPQLTPKQEKAGYKNILAMSEVDNYLNEQKSEFVEAAKMHQLSPRLFDIGQSAYIRGLDTPRVINKDYCFSDADYTVRLMSVNDPNIMFVGRGFSCQTIDKQGIYPALSSVQDPFSRAMAVENKGETVGLAWLWVTEEEKDGKKFNSLCIDNLELANYVIGDKEQILAATQKLAIKIAEENNLRRVTMGAKATHYSPAGFFPETEALPLPEVYENQSEHPGIHAKINYGDSAHQVLVYENFAAEPLAKNDDKQFYVAHRDAYTITDDERQQALEVGDAAYPWRAEFREEDKNSKFMMLKNFQNKVVGYALYSDTERHIHDVAVHPDYRRYSKKMLYELLNHMKEKGGVWEAETRKDTSYALLVKLGQMKKINLTEKDTHIGIQGEKLYKTYISFPENDSAGISRGNERE